jgi:cation:H+ antiporter
MDFLLYFYLFLAIVILYYGAEFTLNSAELVGHYLGLSPLIIGALIVGFGTSLPEFFVSQLACFRGEPSLAFGNVIGSNIANIFLILGVGSLLQNLPLRRKEVRHQLIIHFFLSILIGLALFNGHLGWSTVAVFACVFSFYLWMVFKEMKSEHVEEEILADSDEKVSLLTVLKLFLGFTLLYAGGELLVYSGTGIGKALGISTYVISAIFVAFGTSFPELVTVLMASLKKKDTDIIVGNILGSNIFNVALVFGSLGIYDIHTKSFYPVEIAMLIGVSVFFLGFHFKKWPLNKVIGVLFLGLYAGIVIYWL